MDVLEERYAEFPGLNLTFETREGILKHCAPKKAAALGELGRRFLEKRQPSLEAQLANVADEIAYNNHDVDDGLRAELITVEQLRDMRLFAEQYDAVFQRYPALPMRRAIHETVRRMIGRVVTDLIEESARRIADAGVHSIEDVRRQPAPLVAYTEPVRAQTLELKRFSAPEPLSAREREARDRKLGTHPEAAVSRVSRRPAAVAAAVPGQAARGWQQIGRPSQDHRGLRCRHDRSLCPARARPPHRYRLRKLVNRNQGGPVLGRKSADLTGFCAVFR